MTTSLPLPSSGDEELNLKQIIEDEQLNKDQDASKQSEFNHLSKGRKLDRLNNLIEKSQLYSKIIADNILQSTLESKNKPQEPEPEPETEQPKRKKRKTGGKKTKKDVVSMLSTNISESTKSTREAIEKSQSGSNKNQPKLITGGTLKDYQLDGLQWLVTLYENGLNGILADEMGLGKTLQCISFLSYLIENGIKGPFLIVVPVSTLFNWYNEIQKFAPQVNVVKYIGTKQERAGINLTKLARTNQIFLTSYEMSIRDFNRLSAVDWKYLIVDEGHRLKNSQCLLIKFLKKLEVPNRLLLTGTPLQNNLNELWSLLNFILPDIFQDLELFQQWFNFDELTSFAATEGNNDDEDEETKRLIKKNIQETLVKNLHTILQPFILRRLKRDVITNLPPKKEYLLRIPLTKLQKKIYADALDNRLFESLVAVNLKEFIENNQKALFEGFDINRYLLRKGNKVIANPTEKRTRNNRSYKEAESDDEFESEVVHSSRVSSVIPPYEEAVEKYKDVTPKSAKQKLIIDSLYHDIYSRIRRLKLQNVKLIQLRNICNSPYMYYEPFEDDESNTGKFMDLVKKNLSKFQVLDQLLGQLLPNGHKLLIFCQFTKVLDLLEVYLHNLGIQTCYLDGSTNHEVRQEQIDEFNSDSEVKVFLLSTRAGGLGLNLTAADTVILWDSDWNPQADLQAIDRVHRIGQTKPVKIYRFMVKESIEEILLSKSGSKRVLEKLVMKFGGAAKYDEDLNINQMMELSKLNFKSSEEENDDEEVLLSDKEMKELMDRSMPCYASSDDSQFEKIKVFETVNSMDK
ncbi:putative ATP-dependent helicase IRC5 [Candida viswanathii]|uniref:Putative ATP-dependent helicase IRC5 n=1 Tax=Candida viswanathii TaxID=5486 RepID=A0A367XPR1_9ASCO|nr:putative ATP-dependent helicase IRC5 [Candida viswanathii]